MIRRNKRVDENESDLSVKVGGGVQRGGAPSCHLDSTTFPEPISRFQPILHFYSTSITVARAIKQLNCRDSSLLQL
jgi:hypothetical protein